MELEKKNDTKYVFLRVCKVILDTRKSSSLQKPEDRQPSYFMPVLVEFIIKFQRTSSYW